jgi:hypothetical protein
MTHLRIRLAGSDLELGRKRPGVTTMEQLSVGEGSMLYWVQPKSWERRYELRSGQQLFATLGGQTDCSTVAIARSAQSVWTLKQGGFHNCHVTVRDRGTQTNVAVYQPRWLGDGCVPLPDGRSYRWRSRGLGADDWCFCDGSGTPLLVFRRHGVCAEVGLGAAVTAACAV